MLPTPSIESFQYSDGGNNRNKIFIYIIESFIISAKQFRWIASIKHAVVDRIRCKIIWIDEYYITENCIVNAITYDLKYLSEMFNASRIIYPTPLFPADTKNIYKNLCMIGTKLYKKDILYKELLLGIAIDFNNKFTISQRHSHRKLYGQVVKCIEFLIEQDPKSLKGDDLKLAHQLGGKIRAKQLENEKKDNVQRLKILLQNPKFIKKNGRHNIKLLTEEMKMTRQTITTYLKNIY